MYVREMAWRSATPKGWKSSRAESFGSQKVEMPKVIGSPYYIELTVSAGLVTYHDGVIVPLSWQEIEAWARCTGRKLSIWAFDVIRKLSSAYAAQSKHSTDPNCGQPMYEGTEEGKARTEESLKDALRSRRKKR